LKKRLNSKNGCIKHPLNYGILGVNKGLFTNACKKALKYVHFATRKTLKIEVIEEELKDTFVKVVTLLLVQKEDQSTYKKSYLKSTSYNDKHSNNFQ